MARKDALPGQKETAIERRRKAMEYRKAGLNYRAIAERLGCAAATAFRDVQAALDDISEKTKETTKQLITLECERLDVAVTSLYGKVMRGEVGAVDRWIRVSESRRKLLALDKEFPEDAPPPSLMGIDPALCSPEELAALYDIIRRQNEKRSGAIIEPPTDDEPPTGESDE